MRTSALLIAGTVGLIVLQPVRVSAQWWSSAPADFEECADKAEKAATKEEKTTALAECNAKFAGRRKAGGGYAYYDFMQDRTFDIAGPNPTPEEQKYIDQQYTVYLENDIPKVPIPVQRPTRQQQAAANDRLRAANCAKHSFSCDWPKLSESLNGLKKLFSSTSAKDKRS
jgi:hypothetical protein